MNKTTYYLEKLDAEAAREKQLAEQAQQQGDEREKAIHLMKESMLSDMLKALGRVQLENPANHAMENLAAKFDSEEKQWLMKQDADLADRAAQKRDTLLLALRILREAEAQE